MWVSHEWDNKSSYEWDIPIHDLRGIFLGRLCLHFVSIHLKLIMKFKRKKLSNSDQSYLFLIPIMHIL